MARGPTASRAPAPHPPSSRHASLLSVPGTGTPGPPMISSWPPQHSAPLHPLHPLHAERAALPLQTTLHPGPAQHGPSSRHTATPFPTSACSTLPAVKGHDSSSSWVPGPRHSVSTRTASDRHPSTRGVSGRVSPRSQRQAPLLTCDELGTYSLIGLACSQSPATREDTLFTKDELKQLVRYMLGVKCGSERTPSAPHKGRSRAGGEGRAC